MAKSSRWLVPALLVGLCLGGASPWAQTAVSAVPVPVEDFFRRPALGAPQLSPSGKQIAMLSPGPNGRMVLAIADVATPQRRVGVARFDDADVGTFAWVNDKRLVFDAVDLQAPLGQQRGRGLYAVDTDGNEFVRLIGRAYFTDEGVFGGVAGRPLRPNHRFRSTLPGASDNVLIERSSATRRDDFSVAPLLLDTRTRATRELVTEAPDNAMDWVYDRDGVPRATTTFCRDGSLRVFWRSADDKWSEIGRGNAFAPVESDFAPLAVGKDQQLLVSAGRADAGSTTALFAFDTAAKLVGAKPLVAVDGFDFNGRFIFDADTRDLLGVRVAADADDTVWFDDSLRKL